MITAYMSHVALQAVLQAFGVQKNETMKMNTQQIKSYILSIIALSRQYHSKTITLRECKWIQMFEMNRAGFPKMFIALSIFVNSSSDPSLISTQLLKPFKNNIVNLSSQTHSLSTLLFGTCVQFYLKKPANSYGK